MNDGGAYDADKYTPVRFLPYDVGSVITITLELAGNGSLAASIAGNDPFKLFNDMLEAGGFWP
jgi:hypothetical protein